MMMISYRLKSLEFSENCSSLTARFSANASQFFPPHVASRCTKSKRRKQKSVSEVSTEFILGELSETRESIYLPGLKFACQRLC